MGVVFDDQLTMAAHISSVCRSCFFQLRQLCTIRRSLRTEATRALVQAFVSCRLDYCNSLLAGVADVHIRRLQLLQIAAARLVDGARRCDHISPVLAELHWLPIRQRITFKIAVLVWKCLHDKALRYLADVCIPVTSVEGRCQLHSATTGTLLLPGVQTSTGSGASQCLSPQLEQSTSFVTRPRTVAEHLQAPAEDSAFPACVNYRPAPLWLNSEFGAAYKYPDSTQLSMRSRNPITGKYPVSTKRLPVLFKNGFNTTITYFIFYLLGKSIVYSKSCDNDKVNKGQVRFLRT